MILLALSFLMVLVIILRLWIDLGFLVTMPLMLVLELVIGLSHLNLVTKMLLQLTLILKG